MHLLSPGKTIVSVYNVPIYDLVKIKQPGAQSKYLNASYKCAVTARSKILNKAHKDSTSRIDVSARSEILNEGHKESTLRMAYSHNH